MANHVVSTPITDKMPLSAKPDVNYTRDPSPRFSQRLMKPFQLANISIGFLGIQFAWMIQMVNMSPILNSLKADPVWIAIISCAGPVTGVMVQPIIGALSDRSKIPLGRRRPFLLLGALLTAMSLFLMPHSHALWMAAILLWILDASINISQGPYRSLVPDVVHPTQQASAYSMMSLTIGLGSVLATLIGANIQHIQAFIASYFHTQIDPVQTLFYMGATAMLLAMGWTCLSTPEPDPKYRVSQSAEAQQTQSSGNFLLVFFRTIFSMPAEALKLCFVHSLTWFGFSSLFVFFSLYIPYHVLGALNSDDPIFKNASQYVSTAYMIMNISCFLFSPFIGKLCALTSKKTLHTFGLLCLAGGLISLFFIHDLTPAMIAMGFIGIGWATTLSLPFALLSEHVPPGQEGVLMGTFNVFIAAPGVISNLVAGLLITAFHNNYAMAMVTGGAAVILSAILLQSVREGVSKDVAIVPTGH